ncbi:MAG: ABC transporter substrate-binding protein [Bacilli bacterium]|jgi:spermidine/putrescine transport system substrate-binding protein
MKKFVTIALATLLLGGAALPSLQQTKVDAASEKKTLRIYNWEDYIYEPESADEQPSIIDQFIAFKAEAGVDVTVVYDTFATNEDMYNIMKLGKSSYDLIAPSDYMIQKMAFEGMLEKYEYDAATQTYANIPNYNTYASKYLKDIYDEIEVSEYAVGYMWGTLGIVYNPNLPDGRLDAQMMEDVKSWTVLWDEKYKGKISIKDSMRDAYVVGLLYVHKETIETLQATLAAGSITEVAFKERMAELLNDTTPETVEKVSQALKELKKNIYGLEVDSGKNDIVTGKITMNTAWSGDAVYAMDIAEEEEGVELYYSIPDEGANIWFDGWVMPKGADKELAADFLNFISNPEIAALNMDYIGYTSFIAGQEVLSLIHDWYDAEAGGTMVDLTYFFEGTVDVDPEDPATSMIIYSDLVNRQLTAQYPSEEEILRCVIMEHFDNETNNRIVEMWADFKATTIAAWMIVLIVLLVLGGGGYLVFEIQRRKKSKRHARKAAKSS